MGRRFQDNLPWYCNFSCRWPGVGLGRYWKRKYNKAARRAWKNERHVRGLVQYNSMVKWKTW